MRMEEDKGEIRTKIIDLFLFKNKKKQVRMKYENNLWETQTIINKKMKNILINLFILYFLLCLIYILLFININYYVYKRNKIFDLIIIYFLISII